jgi:hypothetical protein
LDEYATAAAALLSHWVSAEPIADYSIGVHGKFEPLSRMDLPTMMHPVVKQRTTHPPQNNLSTSGRNVEVELTRRLTPDVDDRHVGPVPDFVTRAFYSNTKIHFFAIEEEGRMK